MRPSVVLIGFQEQGNLGIGYVAAVLIREGYAVRILDFRQSRQSSRRSEGDKSSPGGLLADLPVLHG